MKKILAFALALCLALSLAACGGAAASSAPAASLPENLEEIMDASLAGFAEDELPMMPTAEDLELMHPGNTGKYFQLPADMADDESVYYTGVERAAYTDAIIAEPMMGPIPFRIVLLRAESAEAAAELAKNVEANADPRWNICTEAEKVAVVTVEDVVLLAMTDASIVDKVVANFQGLAA